jgi:hypothetical protein
VTGLRAAHCAFLGLSLRARRSGDQLHSDAGLGLLWLVGSPALGVAWSGLPQPIDGC